MPPALTRIFERVDRLEPLFAHRAQKGKRLGPLLHHAPPPSFPDAIIDLESRPPRQRGSSWEYRGGDQSPSPRARPDDLEVLEPRGHGAFSQSYPHPAFSPPPGPRSPRKQGAGSSAVLAETVYGAPVVPGIPPVWIRKRRPQTLPRRERSNDARAKEARGGQKPQKPAQPPDKPRPGATRWEREAEKKQVHEVVIQEMLSEVVQGTLDAFIGENLESLSDDGASEAFEVVGIDSDLE
mmetsp:Transcript_12009/g.22629  ORF Transcript_12009/g.22629 Transcript_12009/m.22629 type:complete len:238 (+) Transcript_12009:2-715(+)